MRIDDEFEFCGDCCVCDEPVDWDDMGNCERCGNVFHWGDCGDANDHCRMVCNNCIDLPFEGDKIIAVRQPWAWLLVKGFKPVENRSWRTEHRGRLYILASKKNSKQFSIDWSRAREIFNSIPFAERGGVSFPDPDHPVWKFGGIIGKVELDDIVDNSTSIWAEEGQKHWMISDGKELPFERYKGKLRLFEYKD